MRDRQIAQCPHNTSWVSLHTSVKYHLAKKKKRGSQSLLLAPLTSHRDSLRAARPWLSSLEPLFRCPLHNLPAKVTAARKGMCQKRGNGRVWVKPGCFDATFNLLGPKPADSSSDQLSLLILCSTSQLCGRDRPHGWEGCVVPGAPCPTPDPAQASPARSAPQHHS